MISIVGLNKADVLAALYNASRPQGMGFMQYRPEPMGRSMAEDLLSQTAHFDYILGRVMKLNLSSDDSFEERLYDRDNGAGSAARVIVALRAQPGLVNAPELMEMHETDAAANVKVNLTKETVLDGGGVLTLGLADVAEPLGAAVDRALSTKQ